MREKKRNEATSSNYLSLSLSFQPSPGLSSFRFAKSPLTHLKKETQLPNMGAAVTKEQGARDSKYGKGFGSSDAQKEKSEAKAGGKPVAKSNLKKPVKKVDRSKIGQPTNFQHTGHIGIGEMRSGGVDPEKIKEQMMTVAATIKLDDDDEDENKAAEKTTEEPLAMEASA